MRGHVDDDFADGVTDGPVREGRREGRSRQARAGNEETSHYQLFYEETSPYQLFLAVDRCGQRILDGCMPQHATDAAGRVSPARYATLTQAGAHIVWGAGLASGGCQKKKSEKATQPRTIQSSTYLTTINVQLNSIFYWFSEFLHNLRFVLKFE